MRFKYTPGQVHPIHFIYIYTYIYSVLYVLWDTARIQYLSVKSGDQWCTVFVVVFCLTKVFIFFFLVYFDLLTKSYDMIPAALKGEEPESRQSVHDMETTPIFNV